MSTMPPDLPADPFDYFESIGVVLAFVFSRGGGESALRALLGNESLNLSREDVMEAARELNQAGMRTAAAIVTEIAATKPSADDLVFCPYDPNDPANKANVASWSKAQERRQMGPLSPTKPKAVKA